MLNLVSPSQYKPGIIFYLLKKSYGKLLGSSPKYFGKEVDKWKRADKLTFDNLNTVGQCSFISCLKDKPVGFISYNPRKKPVAIIGQNCILPEYQGKGFGKKQLKNLLRIIKAKGFKKAKVSTNSHPFFVPAQKMYLACGFKEKRRYKGGLHPKYKMIEFEKVFS